MQKNLSKRKFKSIKRKWLAILILAALTGILTGLKHIPWVSEYIFARGFSRAWIFVFGNISSLFPFSLFEVFILIAVGYILYCIVTWIVCAFKKNGGRFKRNFTNLCLAVAAVLLVYTAVASPAYFRDDLKAVPLYGGGQLTTDETRDFAAWYVDEINALAVKFERDENNEVICPYTFDGLAQKMVEEFRRFDGNNYMSSYTPRAKPSFLNFMWIDFRISGITFAPLGECVTVNKQDIVSICHTMAHELSHTKGVMRENDANLISYYILFSAEDDFIRYCGMTWFQYVAFDLLAAEPSLKEFSQDLALQLNPYIIADDMAYLRYWNKPSVFGGISSFFNNLYLKLSGSSKGTGSYGDQGGNTDYIPVEDAETGEFETIPVFYEYSRVYKMIIAVYQNRII